MDGFGIAGPDYMRTRGAARAGAAPRALNPAASPTLIVGATQDEAKKYSIHSFRSYLCSALMASGRSDAEIQYCLRWASEESLKVYKVTNIDTYSR